MIQLRRGSTTVADPPSWIDVARGRRSALFRLVPSVDRLLARHGLPVLVTREHVPGGERWTLPEVDAGLDRIYRLVLRENRGIPPQLLAELRVLPEVSFVRPGPIGIAELPEAQALRAGRRPDQKSRDAILLPEAHMLSTGDDSVIVAVLDTGMAADHPELAGRLLPGRDFVDIIDGAGRFIGDYLGMDADPDDQWVGHGIHVAGIIAGRGQNMPVGVAPKCKILPVRVLGALREGDRVVGAGLVDNINVALKWAVDQGAKVINMSLGVQHTGGGLPYESVIRYARAKDVTVVAASGNSGNDELYYPSALPHVISVGAVDGVGEVAAFSSYGRHVDLVAPGSEIYSSFLRGGYAFSSGTSQAAPFVAGAAALLHSHARSRGRTLRDRQIKYVLRHSTDRIDRRHRHPKAGYGRLNVRDALRLLDHKLG